MDWLEVQLPMADTKNDFTTGPILHRNAGVVNHLTSATPEFEQNSVRTRIARVATISLFHDAGLQLTWLVC